MLNSDSVIYGCWFCAPTEFFCINTFLNYKCCKGGVSSPLLYFIFIFLSVSVLLITNKNYITLSYERIITNCVGIAYQRDNYELLYLLVMLMMKVLDEYLGILL
jgi:hypothetical protein